jgi:hypothetical protein
VIDEIWTAPAIRRARLVARLLEHVVAGAGAGLVPQLAGRDVERDVDVLACLQAGLADRLGVWPARERRRDS